MRDSDNSVASRGHSTNLVGVPTGLLASVAFNDYPLPLSISGTRETNQPFFDALMAQPDAVAAANYFENYMRLIFSLNGDPRE